MPALEKIAVETHPAPSRIDADPRWAAVQRILASQNFAKSGRMSAFLVYICRCALEDRSEEITEQQIGIHVFSRPADYSPGDDNIVRTTARQLRQRLALYYQEEGGAERVRIEVPKGGYHPSFVDLVEQPAVVESPPIEPGPLVEPQRPVVHEGTKKSETWARPKLALSLALLFGACFALLGERLVKRLDSHPSLVDPLWTAVFVSGQRTLFVSGDAGLNMYDNLARTQVRLGDYVNGGYLSTPEAQSPIGYTWASVATRRYVSWVDLAFADQLRQIEESRHAQYSIKFARDLHSEDLRNANIILVGSPTYNPWVEMFDGHLNFHLHYDGVHNSVGVTNLKPQSGEPHEYSAVTEDPSHRGYTHGFGYIAMTTNLEGNGKVLIIEGSTVAGVDASISFLMNESKMAPILKQAALANKGLGDFEVLLGANFLKSSSPDAQVLATRFYR